MRHSSPLSMKVCQTVNLLPFEVYAVGSDIAVMNDWNRFAGIQGWVEDVVWIACLRLSCVGLLMAWDASLTRRALMLANRVTPKRFPKLLQWVVAPVSTVVWFTWFRALLCYLLKVGTAFFQKGARGSCLIAIFETLSGSSVEGYIPINQAPPRNTTVSTGYISFKRFVM